MTRSALRPQELNPAKMGALYAQEFEPCRVKRGETIVAVTDIGARRPYAVSHLGWGMNPQARWYNIALNGDAPERSRAAARVFAGNFLFSTGPNSEGGGKRRTRGQYDVPMRDCTVLLDNEVIIDKGAIVDGRMRVQRVQH
jgi:hypothetical protein